MKTAILSSKGPPVVPKAARDDTQADRAETGVAQVAGCLYRPERQRLSDAETKTAIRAKLKARNAA
jgi:hypothetical protein